MDEINKKNSLPALWGKGQAKNKMNKQTIEVNRRVKYYLVYPTPARKARPEPPCCLPLEHTIQC
jgi:hypothetical protein